MLAEAQAVSWWGCLGRVVGSNAIVVCMNGVMLPATGFAIFRGTEEGSRSQERMRAMTVK
jgi:hypothetical protein